jgi:hypothetical protein
VSGRAWRPTALALDDAELVLGLERLEYPGSDVTTRAYFDWLYRRNPAGEGIVWYAATGDPDTPSAGHYAVVPLRVAVHREPVTASLALNTLTHPRYRRQRVFTTLAEHVFTACRAKDIAFTYAFPNPRSFPGFRGPLGFTALGRLPLLLAPLRGGEVPDGVRGRLLGLAARGAYSLSAVVRAWGRGPRCSVRDEAPNSDAWDALWAGVCGKYPVMGIRDGRHVVWRYGACPTRRYRLYTARGPRGVLGFVATRVDEVLGLRAGFVVDLLVLPGEMGGVAAASLLDAALAEFTEAHAAVAVALVPRHTEEYMWLRRAAFFACPRAFEPQPFDVVLRCHAAAPAVPEDIGEWLLTMGDYDVV